jgi:sucrose-6-phosphate hydrolase SacC (GH32 family)
MTGRTSLKWTICIALVVALPTLTSCAPAAGPAVVGTPMPLDEPYRPQYHLSVPQGWANDPNGLVYYDGEYHLFYQHNPDDTVWGPMHWGHAVSTDLVNWTHLPIALYPDELGTIFSGSAVIDWDDTAGFGEEVMVAIFTHNDDGRQMQSLAYSTDDGRTWTKYDGNPVLEPPRNIRNFRDPKVFWYEPEGQPGHWVMAVSAGNLILFFTSSDLKQWETGGGFGLTHGATCGVWETPDLFELPVDGGPETRWVLAVAIGGCAPAGGSGVQYFVGDFDGEVFTSENDKDTILWVDYGADFYAPQSWNRIDDRRVWLAWMNNWPYAQEVPTATWRGSFTIPRELALVSTPNGPRLTQKPAAELERLRDDHREWRDETVTPGSDLLDGIQGERLEIIAEFRIDDLADADRFGFRVRSGADEQTTIGYAVKGRMLYVDRGQSGKVDFSPAFSPTFTAPLEPVDGVIRLHVLVDRASVEVFGNDGLVAITAQIFPSSESLGLELFVDGDQAHLNALDIWTVKPAGFTVSP